ncbi:MAG: hypothetical protein ACI4EQ_00430 [Lachnospiraceae bacterium]
MVFYILQKLIDTIITFFIIKTIYLPGSKVIVKNQPPFQSFANAYSYAVNNVLRRCNGVRNEKDRFIISGKPSGNHAIRKTCISELHDSQLLSDRMISDFAGHKDISTTQKYYIHSVTPLTEKADVFAKVFGSKAM